MKTVFVFVWLHFPLCGFILKSRDYLDLFSVEKKEIYHELSM